MNWKHNSSIVFLMSWNILILVCIYSTKIESAINGENKNEDGGNILA